MIFEKDLNPVIRSPISGPSIYNDNFTEWSVTRVRLTSILRFWLIGLTDTGTVKRTDILFWLRLKCLEEVEATRNKLMNPEWDVWIWMHDLWETRIGDFPPWKMSSLVDEFWELAWSRRYDRSRYENDSINMISTNHTSRSIDASYKIEERTLIRLPDFIRFVEMPWWQSWMYGIVRKQLYLWWKWYFIDHHGQKRRCDWMWRRCANPLLFHQISVNLGFYD